MHFDTLQGWLKWQETLHPKTIDMGLERVGRVYRALNPKHIKPVTVTVAGTNGKGSTIAYLETIFREQGYRVGAYTSPHILEYNERITVDGKPVSDDLICASFERIEEVREETSLSYFEFGTLAALDIFYRSDLDVQLLEVGLGGRLDAVNIVDADVALITSICIDHCDWLGETREAIGREKAGIYRENSPAVIGDPDPPKSLLECAEAVRVPLSRIGRDFTFEINSSNWDWRSGDKILSSLPFPALQGNHQFRNAASALQALKLIEGMLPVSEDSIRRGLENVRLDGRFQSISGDCEILLDVGHNPQAARVMVEFLKEHYPNKRIHAVFNMMRDKDFKGVIETMKSVIYDWYIAPLKNPRTAEERDMLDAFRACSVDNVFSGFSGFSDAFAAAKSDIEKDDLIIVFGSFFLVAEFLAGQHS
ncbi:MAG: bifunctional tetrahydrofolate synthase/dihydrofolate synthase [Gammaproteobacteria bacterium]